MVTTYQYGTGDDAITYIVDYSGEDNIVVEKNPFLIQNKKVDYYTISGTEDILYPHQLVSTSTVEGKTLSAKLVDAGKVTVLGAGTGGTDVDMSDTVLNAVLRKGKNQPYSYVVLTVSKQLYLDLEINLVQKSTMFQLNIYGMNGKWVYERLEDSGSAYDITLVSPAYYLKTITLLSLFNFTISNNVVTLTNVGISTLDDGNVVWTNNEGVFYITFDNNRRLTFGIKRVSIGASEYQYTLTKLIDVKVDDLFAFLAHYVAKYPFTDMDIQAGYYYNYPNGEVPNNIHPKYTMQDIEGISNTKTLIPSNDDTFNKVTIRLDEFASDVLESLALLSNRVVVFDDKAYFKPINYTSSGHLSINWQPPESFDIVADLELSVDASTTEIANKLGTLPALSDAQEGDIVYVSYPDSISCGDYLYHNDAWIYQYNVDFPHVLSLAENDDQGSQYILASQKVQCEAYEATVAISDTTSTYVAQDLVFPGADDTRENSVNNSVRNKQAKIIALNSVVKNYKPGDCIVYSVNETTEPTITLGTRGDLNAPAPTGLNQGFIYETYLPGTNDSEVALSTPFISKSIGNTYAWFEYDTDEAEISQYANVMSCASQIIDEHNGITLEDVPVALITIEYPACLTTYTWGRPEFMDEESQFRDISAVTQDSVLDNTSDTGISSSDATKIVVGNQYVHQLQNNRAGFTGLIMEKNADNNVYRLVGYNNGVIQAQFNSEGKIEAGAGVAQLDEDGLTVYYNSADYVESDALKFKNKDNPQVVPYRLFATYNAQNRSTKSSVQAISQTINNVDYTATLEMLCNLGGATNTPVAFTYTGTNPITLANDQIIDLVTGISTHSVMIKAGQSAVINGLQIILTQSDGDQQTEIFDYTNTAKVMSIYPKTFTTISYKNVSGATMSIDMDQWSISYIQTNGDGASFTLSSSGTEIKGDTKISGNFIQTDGTVEFNGPDNGGIFSAASPAIFKTPVYSLYQVLAPSVVGQASVTSPLVEGTHVRATNTIGYISGNIYTSYMDSDGVTTNAVTAGTVSAGKISTSYKTLDDLACRRIYIGSSQPSGPQNGDIWFVI